MSVCIVVLVEEKKVKMMLRWLVESCRNIAKIMKLNNGI